MIMAHVHPRYIEKGAIYVLCGFGKRFAALAASRQAMVSSYGHLFQSRKRRIRATWMVYHMHNALRKSLHSYIPPFYFTITSPKQGRLASPAPFRFETVSSEAYCAYTIQNQNRL